MTIKVGTAASNYKEIDILNRLANHISGEKSLGKGLIPSVFDHFHVHGPNGTHPCLVTTLATCSLAHTIVAGDHEPFQTNVARSLAAQLAMAVAYMHSVGFVHGGE